MFAAWSGCPWVLLIHIAKAKCTGNWSLLYWKKIISITMRGSCAACKIIISVIPVWCITVFTHILLSLHSLVAYRHLGKGTGEPTLSTKLCGKDFSGKLNILIIIHSHVHWLLGFAFLGSLLELQTYVFYTVILWSKNGTFRRPFLILESEADVWDLTGFQYLTLDCYTANVVGEADQTPGINWLFSITLQVKSHVGL